MDRKEKVLYTITKSNWGGAQKYVFDIATHLPKRLEPVVALGGKGSLAKKLEEKNIRLVTVESFQRDINILKEIESFFELLRIIKDEQPDIVHVNSSKAGGLGALAARLLGVRRIVFTAHGWAFKEDKNPLSQLIIKLSSWATVVLSHKAITVSEEDREQAEWMPFVQNKISTTHNGIESPIFKNKDEARDFLKQRANEKLNAGTWIGMIAELHKNKGVGYAIEAFSKLAEKNNDVVLTIIGEGEERERLESLIAKKGLNKRVFLVGDIPNAAEYLKAFDIFMLTSVKEGLPYTLLEAGLAELPVVATCVGGVPEIVDDMASGIIIKPKSSEEIQNAVLYLMENKEKRLSFGQTLREKIERDFNLKNMLNKTVKNYKY